MATEAAAPAAPEVDPWFGQEPPLPPPSDEPPVEETPAETPPPAEPTEPDEVEEVEDADEGGEAAAAEPPAAEPDRPRSKRPTWKELREAERRAAALEGRLAEIERQAQERQAAAEAAQRRTQEQAASEGEPGVTRPWTQADLVELKANDPLRYNEVMAEMSYAAAQQAQREAQELRAQQLIQEQAAAVRRTAADYDDALVYLQDRRTAWYKHIGYNDQQVQWAIQRDLNEAAQVAVAQGKTLPQVLYATAQFEGWKAPVAEAAQPDPDPAPAQTLSPADKVKASRERTQLAQTSLSNVPGKGTGKGLPTRDALMKATQSQLDAWDAEHGPGWEAMVE